MITAQDIQEKGFETARNGYDMDQVDDFLDEMADAITALTQENTELKNKMKVLVQKVDEYRQTEDSMRLALLSAQKLSAQIETEARERADTTVSEAQAYADRIMKEATDGIANEEAKLEEAKKATKKFFDHMRSVCGKQIEFYNKLSQMTLVGMDETPAEEAPEEPEVTPEQEMEETVRSISDAAHEAALEEPAEEHEQEPEEPAEPEKPARRAAEEKAEALGEEEEPTRLYASSPKPKKKKRSFDDFSFDDDI